MSNINISMVSTDKLIFLKMRYKDFFVATRQKINGTKEIKFPVKILLKGFVLLQTKRFNTFTKKVIVSLASLI
jgi:hypothetical protein